MSHQEAVNEIRYIHNPQLAAKKLQELAQSYGCPNNLSIMVLKLTLSSIYKQEFISKFRRSEIRPKTIPILPNTRSSVTDSSVNDIQKIPNGALKTSLVTKKFISEEPIRVESEVVTTSHNTQVVRAVIETTAEDTTDGEKEDDNIQSINNFPQTLSNMSKKYPIAGDETLQRQTNHNKRNFTNVLSELMVKRNSDNINVNRGIESTNLVEDCEENRSMGSTLSRGGLRWSKSEENLSTRTNSLKSEHNNSQINNYNDNNSNYSSNDFDSLDTVVEQPLFGNVKNKIHHFQKNNSIYTSSSKVIDREKSKSHSNIVEIQSDLGDRGNVLTIPIVSNSSRPNSISDQETSTGVVAFTQPTSSSWTRSKSDYSLYHSAKQTQRKSIRFCDNPVSIEYTNTTTGHSRTSSDFSDQSLPEPPVNGYFLNTRYRVSSPFVDSAIEVSSSDNQRHDSEASAESSDTCKNGNLADTEGTDSDISSSADVSDEQIRNWELMLENNTEALFNKELGTLERGSRTFHKMPNHNPPPKVMPKPKPGPFTRLGNKIRESLPKVKKTKPVVPSEMFTDSSISRKFNRQKEFSTVTHTGTVSSILGESRPSFRHPTNGYFHKNNGFSEKPMFPIRDAVEIVDRTVYESLPIEDQIERYWETPVTEL